jgi:hypothetical protein
VSAVGRVLVVVKPEVAESGVEQVALVEVLVVLLVPGPWKLVVCMFCMSKNSFFPLHRASLQSETQGGLANSS